MAENDYLSFGSQESLPLSEESFRHLYQQLDGQLTNIADDADELNNATCDMINGINIKYEAIIAEDQRKWNELGIVQDLELPLLHVTTNIPEQKQPPSSLPASESWPGEYSFRVSFKSQENIKGITWIFSEARNKLYVGKDVPCPVNFSTSVPMSNDVCIRAMALFSSSDQAFEAVKRCVNHSFDEISKGATEARHLVRSESKMAWYEEDPVTERHSVVVPFENPPVGQQFSSYIYKFMCFGSCAGGPNRRPLMLVFTLEKSGKVIGRQKIDLKICACPSRDCRADEKQMKATETKEIALSGNKPVKRSNDDKISEMSKKAFLNKKLKPEPEKTEPYVIKVRDRRCYEFLREMKRYFVILTVIKKQYPRTSDFLYRYSSPSSGE